MTTKSECRQSHERSLYFQETLVYLFSPFILTKNSDFYTYNRKIVVQCNVCLCGDVFENVFVQYYIMMVGSVPHCESLRVGRLFSFLDTDRAENKSNYDNPFYDQTLPKLR